MLQEMGTQVEENSQAAIRRLQKTNAKLVEVNKFLLGAVDKISDVLKTMKLTEESAKYMAMIEGIKKVDAVAKIKDPGEWSVYVLKFISVSGQQNGSLQSYTEWLESALEVMSRSRREAYTNFWEDISPKLLFETTGMTASGVDDAETVLKWIEKAGNTLDGMIFSLKKFKIASTPPQRSFGLFMLGGSGMWYGTYQSRKNRTWGTQNQAQGIERKQTTIE